MEVLLEDLVRDPVPSCVIMLSCVMNPQSFSSYPKLRKCGIFKPALVDKFLKNTYGAPLVNLPS